LLILDIEREDMHIILENKKTILSVIISALYLLICVDLAIPAETSLEQHLWEQYEKQKGSKQDTKEAESRDYPNNQAEKEKSNNKSNKIGPMKHELTPLHKYINEMAERQKSNNNNIIKSDSQDDRKKQAVEEKIDNQSQEIEQDRYELLIKEAENCNLKESNSFWGYNLANPHEQKTLQMVRADICLGIRDGSYDGIQNPERMIEVLARYYGTCDGNMISERLININNDRLPDSIILFFKQYCQSTKSDLSNIAETYNWFLNEYFCLSVHNIAYPDKLVDSAYQDTPSVKRLRNQADKLCNELRDGKITYGDAWYRWKQEFIIFQKNIKNDMIIGTFKAVYDMLDKFLPL